MTGAVRQAATVVGRMTSGITSVLEAGSGSVFVKGVPADHLQPPRSAATRTRTVP
ncbi:hypothetical protein OG782_04720 [Streptomyces sp. NBC_00876]|uniref:hypothetical protein n=1 Tax=Streptomyces sp. NBC_00876 TaxID=2975853 RepID=UPI0038676E2C|nr:hypothetical protein OG782_04720 [Streptomyces sp. NBC_00876]